MPLYRGSTRLILLRKPPLVVAPSFVAIINFRATAGYVTDGANQTYCLVEAFPTNRGGQTFGWTSSISAADRSSAVDPRFAGINYVAGSSPFRFTLPRTGVFSVNYAIGDDSFSQAASVVIKDNTTTLNTSATLTTTAGQFADISGTVFSSPAAWIAGNTPLALTFSTTSFVLNLAGAGSNAAISSLVITG